jgi:hypothetical protein
MIAAFMMARFAQTSNSSYPHPAFSLYKHAKNATHDLVSIWIREGFPDNLDKFLLPSSPYRRVCRVVCGCVTFLHRHLRYPVLKRPKSREIGRIYPQANEPCFPAFCVRRSSATIDRCLIRISSFNSFWSSRVRLLWTRFRSGLRNRCVALGCVSGLGA